jgi:hypothetical protein
VRLSLFVGERHAVLSCDPASGAYVLNTEEPILFVIGIKALSLKKMVRICFKGIFFSNLYVRVTLEHYSPHGGQVAHTEIYFRGVETMMGGG